MNTKNFLANEKDMQANKVKIIKKELNKIELFSKGLKYGLEAMRCKEKNLGMREQLLVALKRGEVYVPATFFQMGFPLANTEQRITDPRQGKDPLENMMIFIGG